MTVPELAALLKIPEEAIRDLLRDGVLLDDGTWVIDDEQTETQLTPGGPPVVDR